MPCHGDRLPTQSCQTHETHCPPLASVFGPPHVGRRNLVRSKTKPNRITLLHTVGIGDNVSQGVGHLAYPGLLKRIVTAALLAVPSLATKESVRLPAVAFSETFW